VIDHGENITSARKQSKLATVRAVIVVLALTCCAAESAEAGRSQYAWLYGAEVLPEKSVEVQQWVYERNGLVDGTIHDTALWWGVLVGVTDQFEIVMPIELLYRRLDGMGSDFTVEKYGIEARYRFTKLDSEDPDGFGPLLRLAVKRDVNVRNTTIAEADFVLAYQAGKFHGQIDLGAIARINEDDVKVELHPAAGVSIEVKKDLRFGVEGIAVINLDEDLKKGEWIGVGPGMAWTSGRFWLSASFLIGVHQIDTAPRFIWGVLF
jgi:hypothetical protein